MNPIFQALFMQIMSLTVQNLSPVILKELRESLLSLQASCSKTPNPWDDGLCIFLGHILDALERACPSCN